MGGGPCPQWGGTLATSIFRVEFCMAHQFKSLGVLPPWEAYGTTA